MKFYLLLMTTTFAFAGTSDIEIKDVLQAGNNKFSGRMLSNVAQQNPGSSIVLSAFSALSPLAQLALASEGKTHDELLNVIGFPNDDAIIAAFSLINKDIKSIPGIELKIANRIYIPLKYELNDNFAVISKDIFDSEVKNVNFSKKILTAAEINNWVEVETNHRIKDLVKPNHLGDDVRAILVNVLYFKGTWKIQFEKKRTKIENFYIHEKDSIKVSMMRSVNEKFKYGQSNFLEAQILEMPYVGEQSSMIVILPNEVDGIRSLIDKLENLSILDQEIINLYEQEVNVSIPKFKIETEVDLKKLLQSMNVREIFSTTANLKKLLKTDEELFVSEAIQKSFIEVNEEGAEASTASEVTLLMKSPGLPLPEFNANHPFVFVLRNNNINLFSGVFNG